MASEVDGVFGPLFHQGRGGVPMPLNIKIPENLMQTRPKPAYGRQGLDWDRRARIHFGQVHFDPKNVTSLTGGSN